MSAVALLLGLPLCPVPSMVDAFDLGDLSAAGRHYVVGDHSPLYSILQTAERKASNDQRIEREQSQKDNIERKQRLLETAKESTSDTASSASELEECVIPAGECTICTGTERNTYEACKATGKWQKFECLVVSRKTEGTPTDQAEQSPTDGVYKMLSCKRTPLDEQSTMFEVQVICLLMGVLSVLSVRREKRQSASMFDRRKHGATASRTSTIGNNKRSSDYITKDDNEIEFTPMTNQQIEKIPLMAIQPDHMEVV